MVNMEILKTICVLLLGIVGPILCYIVVYGSIFIICRVYLLIKASLFRKRVKKLNIHKKDDDIEEIEVDMVSSYDNRKE